MKYRGYSDFSHGQTDRIGVLVTNLGTPDAPDTPSLRRYLKEFLADPRVVEVPRALWWLILNGVILRIRPKRSAAAYKTVWTEQGSPLLFHTQEQAKQLQKSLAEEYGDDVVVRFAMRYGSPAMSDVIDEMLQSGVRKLVLFPLYPQYSGATSGSTFDALAQEFMQRRWLPDFRFISHYHDDAGYIDACAQQIESFWQQHGRPQKLIFSYHGVPKKYLTQGDPYHCECHKTSRLIAERLDLGKDDYLTTFQSRFGREEWLQPYTDETLKALPDAGVKNVQVFCPGFSADCLETIEEIGEENREYFAEAGGEHYAYIPALNSTVEHINALTAIVKRELKGWSLDHDETARQRRAAARQQHYGELNNPDEST
ncbi:ferrochelatase [Pseudidiomarina terrestris]|uniref:ferrochelatase n=1 Tax=Pseudidiomarina terrestris TaxID=2820060 RepID=UPI00264E7F51|nr:MULTISPECIES: ferrochelatase [unclassified Pseudidiomarina]MDN7135404.1 ferrochelatase [Pseudidiomarina sp. 1ASP75-5]MDN7138564.1 ferrochelatase [Pseudidiomarina sp. 1ASP75-14]MEA3586858.1 ferrochelatase [Pseudidiomarina sp. 1APP75-27a]